MEKLIQDCEVPNNIKFHLDSRLDKILNDDRFLAPISKEAFPKFEINFVDKTYILGFDGYSLLYHFIVDLGYEELTIQGKCTYKSSYN